MLKLGQMLKYSDWVIKIVGMPNDTNQDTVTYKIMKGRNSGKIYSQSFHDVMWDAYRDTCNPKEGL